MTLPSSGPISLNNLAAEYGVPNTTPLASYIGKPGAPTGNPVSLEAFYGVSNTAFTPDGGTVTRSNNAPVSATLSCTTAAVWTFSLPSGMTANIASGASATSVTFTVAGGGQSLSVSVQGVSNGITRNFTVNINTN